MLSGMAGQLTATKGLPDLLLRLWIIRAASSFPVPVSPVMSTVMSVRATSFIVSMNSFIRGDSPTKKVSCSFWLILLSRSLIPLEQALLFENTAQRVQQPLFFEGLGDEVVGPFFHGLDGRLDGTVSGHDDHRQGGVPLPDRAQELHAVHPRHLHIGENAMDALLKNAERGIRTARTAGLHRQLSLDKPLEKTRYIGVIVNDQDRLIHVLSSSSFIFRFIYVKSCCYFLSHLFLPGVVRRDGRGPQVKRECAG